MTTPDSASSQKYYEPAEVEAYVQEVTNTIKALKTRVHEAELRADEVQRGTGNATPETTSVGRALLLASEVADKTISDADSRASEIVHGAQERATAILDAARHEADRVVDSAQADAIEMFRNGEARILSAVGAFMQGSDLLRDKLTRIADDASNWRDPNRPPPGPGPGTFVPMSRPGPAAESGVGRRPETAGATSAEQSRGEDHDRSAGNGTASDQPDIDRSRRISPFHPPPFPSGGTADRHADHQS